MVVVDASVVANALAAETRAGEAARERLARDADLHAPHLLDAEVLSVLRKRSRMGVLDPDRARGAIEHLMRLRVKRYPHGPLVRRMWALRENTSAYDASYIALAEALGAVLVTADARLSRVRVARCAIEVLG